jgi:hypothetical protein
LFLREEVWEEACKCGPRISNTAVRQITMNFKEAKGVEKTIPFSLLKFKILTHLPC